MKTSAKPPFAQSKAAAEIAPIFQLDTDPTQQALQLINTLTSRLSEYDQASTNQQPQIQQSIQDLPHRNRTESKPTH